MIVYRAVGGPPFSPQGDAPVRPHATDALYVTASEIEAVGWGLVLGRERTIALAVACVRDRATGLPLTDWPVAYSGIDGVPLREAIVFPGDIIGD